MWKWMFKSKRICLVLLLPLSFVLMVIVKTNPHIAEYYFARGCYKYASSFIHKLTSTVPFSISEALFLVTLPVAVLYVAIFLYRLIRNPMGRRRMLRVAAFNSLASLSVLVFLFTLLCGVNYYRYDFAHYLDFEVAEYTPDDLYHVSRELVFRANEIRPYTSCEDGEFPFHSSGFKELADATLEAYGELASQYPVFETNPGKPKPLRLSKYLSYTQIVGIFNPFTMEANINVDVPAFTIPANACHEMAHMYGFMKEDEANYIAYLACSYSKNPDFTYSGIMMALSYSLGELYESDYGKYVETTRSLHETVLNDLRLERGYWKNIESVGYQQTIAEVSNTVNNTYLKSNGQTNGVKSYNEMVKLLVAEYKNR